MSIEQTLERIAVALEKMEARYAGVLDAAPLVSAVVPATVIKEKKTTKAAPQAAPVNAPVIQPEADSFTLPGAEEVVPLAKDSTITLDDLKDKLTAHAKAFGTKVTVELIKKHGADAVVPKIATIPTANYAACMTEVESDLKKLKVK